MKETKMVGKETVVVFSLLDRSTELLSRHVRNSQDEYEEYVRNTQIQDEEHVRNSQDEDEDEQLKKTFSAQLTEFHEETQENSIVQESTQINQKQDEKSMKGKSEILHEDVKHRMSEEKKFTEN